MNQQSVCHRSSVWTLYVLNMYVLLCLLPLPAWKCLFQGPLWYLKDLFPLDTACSSAVLNTEAELHHVHRQSPLHPLWRLSNGGKNINVRLKLQKSKCQGGPLAVCVLPALCWSLVLLHASFSSELGLFRSWLGTLERRYHSNTQTVTWLRNRKLFSQNIVCALPFLSYLAVPQIPLKNYWMLVSALNAIVMNLQYFYPTHPILLHQYSSTVMKQALLSTRSFTFVEVGTQSTVKQINCAHYGNENAL